jgi:hypothetical protein
MTKKNFVFLFILGGIPQAFDIIFSNASGTIFTQILTLSQATNISSLVGATSGSPIFRLVTNVEVNSLLPVSLNSLKFS